MNGSAVVSGTGPPSPRASAATSTNGIGESPRRRASSPSTDEPEEEQAQLDQQRRRRRRPPPGCLVLTRTVDGRAARGRLPEPIATRTSPARSTSSGVGEGTTSASRTIATIEQPVSVRARVSPRGRPSNGEPGADREPGGLQPGHLAGEVGEALGQPRSAQHLGDGVGLLGVEPEHAERAVGVALVVGDDLRAALALDDDADDLPGARRQFVPDAHPGQQCLLELHRRHRGRRGAGQGEVGGQQLGEVLPAAAGQLVELGAAGEAVGAGRRRRARRPGRRAAAAARRPPPTRRGARAPRRSCRPARSSRRAGSPARRPGASSAASADQPSTEAWWQCGWATTSSAGQVAAAPSPGWR